MASEQDKIYNLIESWLDGELSPNEATAFEKRLKNDPELQSLAEAHRQARVTIDNWAIDKNLASVKEWNQEYDEKVREERLRKIFFGVAILLLSAVFAFWYFPSGTTIEQPSKKTTQDSLIDEENEAILDEVFPKKEQEKKQEPTIPVIPPKPPETKPTEVKYAFKENTIDSFKQVFIDNFETMGSDAEEDLQKGMESFLKGELQDAKNHLKNISDSDGRAYTDANALLAIIEYDNGNFANAAEKFSIYDSRKIGNEKTDWLLLQFLYKDYKNNQEVFWTHLNSILEEEDHKFYLQTLEFKKRLEFNGVVSPKN